MILHRLKFKSCNVLKVCWIFVGFNKFFMGSAVWVTLYLVFCRIMPLTLCSIKCISTIIMKSLHAWLQTATVFWSWVCVKQHNNIFIFIFLLDEMWMSKLVYLVDMFRHLNKLNTSLHRFWTSIFVFRNKTYAFIKKLVLWDSFAQKRDNIDIYDLSKCTLVAKNTRCVPGICKIAWD